MKHKLYQALLVAALLSAVSNQLSIFAQGTAFTYQGRLSDGANPASGFYDLRFTIYDSTNNPGTIISGPVTNSAASVSAGLFTVLLDFGTGVFSGAPRWIARMALPMAACPSNSPAMLAVIAMLELI